MSDKLNIKPIGVNEGAVHNIDDDAAAYALKRVGYDYTNLEETLRQWFDDHYKDCGVSDILYWTHWSTMRKGFTPDSQFIGREEHSGKRVNHHIFSQTDIDPYKVWYGQCREYGITPWLSFRMNDIHYADERAAYRDMYGAYPENEFFFKAFDNDWMIGNDRYRYWLEGSTKGCRNWFQFSLNYEIPEVRQHILDEIDEMLGKYEVDGVELDWHRQMWCFPKDTVENCKYINSLMEGFRKIIDKYEKIYGHKIKVLVKATRDIDQSMYFGLDIRHYVKMGWIDIVVPSGYWGSTDSDMPIAKWVEEMDKLGGKVKVWAGLECHVTDFFENPKKNWQTEATMAGFAAQYLSQGAEKIYLYNMFNDVREKTAACSSLENALAADNRSYIVTESNCTPYVEGFKEYDPLPIKLNAGQTDDSIVMHHGPLAQNKNNVLFVGITKLDAAEIDEKTLTVKYNGAECEFAGISKKSWLEDATCYGTVVAYKIPQSIANEAKEGKITVGATKALTVAYIELVNGNIDL